MTREREMMCEECETSRDEVIGFSVPSLMLFCLRVTDVGRGKLEEVIKGKREWVYDNST